MSNPSKSQVLTQAKQRRTPPPPPPPRNASKKQVKKKVAQPPRDKLLKAPFLRCLIDPFSPSSIGCTVPDPFPFPTVQHHLHQTTVIGPPGSSSVTSGGVMFLPNPVLSMVDLQHLSALTGSNVSIQSTPFTPFGATATSAASCYYGATSQANLAALYSSYRVVSWGVKISNLQPDLTATGKLIIAYVPVGDTVPSYQDLLSAVTANSCTPILNIDAGTLNSSNILELPTAFEITVQDLLHGDVELSGMYTNSNFWAMKSTAQNGALSTTVFTGDDVAINANGTTAFTSYKDSTRSTGGCAIVCYYEGIPNPASSLVNNVFQFETIYHLEGSPQISNTSKGIPIPSSMPKADIGPMNAVEASMCVASKENNVVHWITKGATFLNDNKESIISGISTVATIAKYAALALA